MDAVTTRHVMNSLVRRGDTMVEWDPENESEVAFARSQFEKALKDGWAAFAVARGGGKGEQIRSFDPEQHRITLVPPMAGG